MPDIFFGTFDTDLIPPVVTNQNPADGDSGVPESSDVLFDVLDDSGVDTSTMAVWFNGQPVVVNGSASPGYSVQYQAVEGGVRVSISADSGLPALTTVMVTVQVRDLAPIFNEATASWSFTTATSFSPVIVDQDPGPGDTGVQTSSPVSFSVLEVSGSGVNLSTLNVTLSDESTSRPAVVDGAAAPGFSLSTSPVAGGYRITISIDGGLLPFETYVATVSVFGFSGPQANESWSWDTEEGATDSPVLNAVGLDSRVDVSWFVSPGTRVSAFVLRKSTVSFPVSVTQGAEVYRGPLTRFADTAVVNGIRYFYSVFVLRKTVGGQDLYLEYSDKASDDAVPKRFQTTPGRIDEYIPAPGDFGVSPTMPWGHGVLVGVWGRAVSGGGRSEDDVWSLVADREVLSPCRGVVTEASSGAVGISTPSGLVIRISGQISTAVTLGASLLPGELIARASGGDVSIRIHKPAGGGYGLRLVRPSYLYLVTERRT